MNAVLKPVPQAPPAPSPTGRPPLQRGMVEYVTTFYGPELTLRLELQPGQREERNDYGQVEQPGQRARWILREVWAGPVEITPVVGKLEMQVLQREADAHAVPSESAELMLLERCDGTNGGCDWGLWPGHSIGEKCRRCGAVIPF